MMRIFVILLIGLGVVAYSLPTNSLPFNDVPILGGAPPPPPPPSGLACDQGPNYTGNGGSAPAPALAASFTHCALNADFTTTTTDSNGINYNNISTWIIECGASSHGGYDFHIQYWFNITSVPCGDGHTTGRAQIKTDPLGGGGNVLDIMYLLSDQTLYLNYESGCGQCGGGYNYSDIGLTWPSIGQGSIGLPYEMYIETTFAVPLSSMNAKNPSAPGTAFFALNSVTTTSAPPLGSQAHLAVDQFEIVQNTTSSGATSWLATSGLGAYGPPSGSVDFSPSAHNFSNQVFTSYHAWGQLITSDEAHYISICTYEDGTRLACEPGGSTGFNVQGGPQCSGGGWACYFGQNSVIFRDYTVAATCLSLSTTPCYSNDVHQYIKSIRIFTCSSYKTTQCPGPIITADSGPQRHYAANDNLSPEDLIRRGIVWLWKLAA